MRSARPQLGSMLLAVIAASALALLGFFGVWANLLYGFRIEGSFLERSGTVLAAIVMVAIYWSLLRNYAPKIWRFFCAAWRGGVE